MKKRVSDTVHYVKPVQSTNILYIGHIDSGISPCNGLLSNMHNRTIITLSSSPDNSNLQSRKGIHHQYSPWQSCRLESLSKNIHPRCQQLNSNLQKVTCLLQSHYSNWQPFLHKKGRQTYSTEHPQSGNCET